MSTEPKTELQPVEENKKLLRSAVADEAIAEFALKVADLDATTDEGYEECKKAIRWCVKARSAVTGLKEELNKAALAHQRAVNAEEKRLIGLVSEVESQLKAKKQAVDDEVERKRKELEAKHEAWIVGRQDHCFAETGNLLPRALAEELSEADFEQLVAAGREAKQKAALEAARIAQQEAEEREAFRQAQAKLAAEKAEFERQQAELKAAQELLARQQAEQAEREREAERKIELQRQQEERDAERKKLLDMPSMRHEPLELDYYDDGGQIAHQTVGTPGSVFASRIQSVDAPMSNQDMAQVEAITNFRIDQASASREEAELASVQDSGDGFVVLSGTTMQESSQESIKNLVACIAIDEARTKLIAPIRSEVMGILASIKAKAARLEALFDDPDNYLDYLKGDAESIERYVESLQEQMDHFTDEK